MLKNRGCSIALVLVVVLAILLVAALDLYTDVAWLDTLGLASVVWRRLGTEWLLFLIGWLVATGVMAGNWLLARAVAGGGHMTVPWLRQQRSQHGVTAEPTTRTVGGQAVNIVLAVVAGGLGFMFALTARAMWLTALMSFEGGLFGQVDPVLGRDVSFFVFHLPWLSFLQGWFLWLVAVSLIGSVLIYLATYSAQRLTSRIQVVDAKGGRFSIRLPRAAERHLLVLGALVLGLIAAGYQLDVPQLLYSTSGAAFGAGYTDVHSRLPVLHLLTGLALVGALVLLVSLVVKVRWLPYLVIGAWVLVMLLGGGVYPGLVQRLAVEPNELAREREYIGHTIEFTRQAYGLDKIKAADFEIEEETADLDVEANESTIQNIRLWDYRPLLRTYGQLQEIRLYYAFSDVDVDRYLVGDDYRQVTLAAREIAQNELPEKAQTWVNRHLVYTHGSGVVLSPVNEVVEEGLPRLWVRDIPPRSVYPELQLTQPGIYYGELTDNYVVVKTKEQELDYPSGDQNVYTSYEGKGGVVLDSPLKRLAYAMRMGDSQVLLSGAITTQSRLLWRRSIRERVEAVAPFLRYDPDPYPVIVDGRLVWLLDAYTVSRRYPYSEPTQTSFGQLNYIRNSVKVAMDAYDGTLTFYLIDDEDPLIRTYASIFPDLFRPASEMDPTLVAHWRYPEGMFLIQAARYQTYHMTDPQVFYNKEDLWNWAEEVSGGERLRIEPYYVNMRLPGETSAEFVLMLPFTPSSKQNMIAWLYARNDGERYGELGVYKFPKQRLVYGPMQVESRIDQDPVISQQLSLWNQRGSQVIRGNLLVIPVDEAILYVEPIYLQAEASQLPELRRVIVSYGNRIAMEETLAEALARVIGAGPVAEPPPEPAGDAVLVEGDVAELVDQADAHYRAAQECLITGNWACYGTEMEALERVLETLVDATRE